MTASGHIDNEWWPGGYCPWLFHQPLKAVSLGVMNTGSGVRTLCFIILTRIHTSCVILDIFLNSLCFREFNMRITVVPTS